MSFLQKFCVNTTRRLENSSFENKIKHRFNFNECGILTGGNWMVAKTRRIIQNSFDREKNKRIWKILLVLASLRISKFKDILL